MANNRNWKRSRLGQYFQIKHGYAFKGEFFADKGDYVLLTPGNFKAEGGIALKGEKEKYYTGAFPKEFLLKRGDLLVVMTDLTQNAPILGSPAFIKEDNGFLHNQRLGKIVDLKESELYDRFLYYLFNSPKVRNSIKASATGSTVKHTAPDRICAIEIDLPPLPTQRTIASVLSAYDDLIENNTRRIALLEEMAQMLYQEWFVKFRFPRYEGVRMVETEMGMVPEGWEVVKLGDAIELAYGKALKAGDRNLGAIPVYGSAGIVGYHDEKLVEGPGIIVGRKGNVGSVFWADSDFYPIDTVFYVRTTLSLYYVYYNLRQQHFINNDAAVPGLSRHQAYTLPFIRPPDILLQCFDEVVKAIFLQRSSLTHKNSILRRTRDMLLPKLVGGEIDVSGWEGDKSPTDALKRVPTEVGQAGGYEMRATRGRGMARVEPMGQDDLEWRSLWE